MVRFHRRAASSSRLGSSARKRSPSSSNEWRMLPTKSDGSSSILQDELLLLFDHPQGYAGLALLAEFEHVRVGCGVFGHAGVVPGGARLHVQGAVGPALHA